MPRRFRLLADLRPLRDSPPFRRLLVGSTLSSTGSSMARFAIMLQVYDLTHSPFAVGALGLAEVVPTLVVGLLGGPVADAMDRRKLVLITTSSAAVVGAAFTAQSFLGLHQVWLLYVLSIAMAAVMAVDFPARTSFMPNLLPLAQQPAGLALDRLGFQIVLVIGPALAGLVAGTSGLGLSWCYAANLVSYLPALYCVARMPAMPPAAEAGRASLRAVREGVRFIGRSQVLAGAFLADLTATVFGLPVALFPAINAERFHGDPRTLGLFLTAIGVGGLISGALSGPVGQVRLQGRAMLWAVAVWGAAFAGFAVAPTLWLTLTLLAVAGAADVFTVVFRMAMVQAVTPPALRGRVMAADYVVGAGGADLGNLEAGALGSLTSPVISAVVGGLLTLVGAFALAVALPAFTRYQRPPARPPGGEPPGAEGLELAAR